MKYFEAPGTVPLSALTHQLCGQLGDPQLQLVMCDAQPSKHHQRSYQRPGRTQADGAPTRVDSSMGTLNLVCTCTVGSGLPISF